MDVDPLTDEIGNDLARWLAVKVDRPREKDGWFTAKKMAVMAKCSYDRANNVLNQGVLEGDVELKEYGNMKFYRLVKKG